MTNTNDKELTKIEIAAQALRDAEAAAMANSAVKKAQEALELAKQEAREAEQNAKRLKWEAEATKKQTIKNAFSGSVVAALNVAGIKSSLTDKGYIKLSDDKWNNTRIRVEEQRQKNTWRYIDTGKYVCVVEAPYSLHDKPRRFPQNAKGVFNLDKIVAYMKEISE